MTNFEKQITTAGKEYSLSTDEKARMQRVVKDYMQYKPIREKSYSVSVSYTWISMLQRPVAGALVLVLIFGSGVSYAAEAALPGDVLYGVKTSLNEPLRVALATNAEAKAEVQIELAERRIEEAATLSSEGRLDDSTQEELAIAFESHAAAASENIAKAGEEDSSATVELASRFETRLVAHEIVLTEVEVESDDRDEESRSHRLTDAIRATNEVLAEARFNRSTVAVALAADTALEVATSEGTSLAMQAEPMMTMAVATDAPSETTDTARNAKAAVAPEPAPAPDAKTISRIQSATEKSLKTAQKALRTAKSLSVDAKARAEGDIKLAGNLLNDGNEYLKNDADADAFAAFEESLRVSEQAVVYIKAAPALEKARARGASRNRGNTTSGKNIEVNVSVPTATINATVTVSTSSSDDGPDHDINDDRTNDSNHDIEDDRGGQIETESNDDSGGGLKFLNKLNISL